MRRIVDKQNSMHFRRIQILVANLSFPHGFKNQEGKVAENSICYINAQQRVYVPALNI